MSGTVSTTPPNRICGIRTRGTQSTAWVVLVTIDEIVRPMLTPVRAASATAKKRRPNATSSTFRMLFPGIIILNVLLVALGLRFFAVALAALTGVSIGLTISSMVTNTTQAVLWVPLVLIPQILFGGVVD